MRLPEPLNHTVEAIYRTLITKALGDSTGVPMSDAANECGRAIWYRLRWSCPPEELTGQKQSRFDTGNLWEERLLSHLEQAGIQIEDIDPATGQQFRVELANGWLRGRMDGRALGVPEAPKTWHVVEVKSHNDRSFKELVKKKLKEAKPEHYAQTQAYMHAAGLTRCLYLAVNKNDDALYAERVEYDAAFALALEAKIIRLVAADQAPPRLYDDINSKAAFACQWCPAKAQCHEGAWARVNCRTCIESEFRDGAIVWCRLKEKELSYDEQQAGCPEHRYLPSLVHGEQLDADEAKRLITYQLKDGSLWIDAQGGASDAA